MQDLDDDRAHLGLGELSLRLHVVKELPAARILHDHGERLWQAQDADQLDDARVADFLGAVVRRGTDGMGRTERMDISR